MIDIFRLTELEDIDATCWNSLLRDSEINELFLTYEWISCWWNCFGSDKELFILVAREFDQIIGIAPLMLSSRGSGILKYTVIEFIGTGESDYCDFIISPDNKESVLHAIFDFLGTESDSWDVISLKNVPEHSSTTTYLQEKLENLPYNSRTIVSAHCPTILLQDDPAFALQCIKKKSLRRHFNHLDKSGHLAFQTAQTRGEIDNALEDFFQQHIERRAIADGLSKFDDPRVRKFYRCLVTNLLPMGWLKFGIVTHDDIPIAYHFGFEYFNKFLWYKPAFNIDYIKKSPGEVLIKYLLEDAIERQMVEFDFTIGDESFKRRFSNKIRKNLRFEIVSRKRIWVALNFINGVKRFVKQKLPRAFSFLKKNLEFSHRNEYRRVLRDTIKNYGILGTGIRAIHQTIRYCLIDMNVVFVYKKQLSQYSMYRPVVDLTVQEGRISDSRIFAKSLSPLERKNLISTWFGRLRESDILFVGKMHDCLVQYAWVSFNDVVRIPGIDKNLILGGDTAFIYDFHIAENCRGRGIFTAALYRLTEQLQESGVKRVLICCNRNNIAARAGMIRAEFELLATYTRVKVFGIPFVLQSNATVGPGIAH